MDRLPQVDAALLDRAFVFSPGSTLRSPEFLATDARIRGLGTFPRYQLDLRAREDEKFDTLFRSLISTREAYNKSVFHRCDEKL